MWLGFCKYHQGYSTQFGLENLRCEDGNMKIQGHGLEHGDLALIK